jgi:L-iditol 2-dehydrogenase
MEASNKPGRWIKAAVLDRPGTSIDVRAVTFDPLGSAQVALRMDRAAICGTDVEILTGCYPWRVQPRYPLVMGHEGVGTVEETGRNVRRLKVGDRVVPFSLHGCGRCSACKSERTTLCNRAHHLGMDHCGTFAERLFVREDSCIRVSSEMSLEDATMLEPLAVVMHTLENVTLRASQSVAVVGAGAIGILHAMTLKALGGRVLLVGNERDGSRLAHARSLGIDTAQLPAIGKQRRAQRSQEHSFDLVIEAGRPPESYRMAFDLVRKGGTVCLKGLAIHDQVGLLPIVRKSLTVTGQGGAAPRHYARALRLMQRGRLHPGAAIMRWYRLDDTAAAFDAMNSGAAIAGIVNAG